MKGEGPVLQAGDRWVRYKKPPRKLADVVPRQLHHRAKEVNGGGGREGEA